MPIDPSIILNARAPQPVALADPLEQYGKALAFQGLMGNQRLQELQTQQAQESLADDQAVRSAYQQAGGDSATLRALLQKGGQYKQLQALDKLMLENRAKEAEIGKNNAAAASSNATVAAKRYEAMGNAFGFVRDNPTQENAFRALDNLGAAGVLTPEQVAQGKATTPTDPAQIRALATQHFQSAMSAKDQLPQYQTRNLGGTTQTLAINPVTGQVTVANSAANTQSPDSVASNATTQRGQNMTQATAIRGQNLTDSRERDVTLAGQKSEAGAYGREKGEARAQAQINLPQVTAQAERGVKLIDDLIGDLGREVPAGKTPKAAHPGFEGAIGISGLGSGFGAAGFIPGTDMKDFKKRLDEIKGGAFLQAFNSLKGGGQITEIEGKKATEAITRMDSAQSEKEFVKAAREFQDIVRAGAERAKAQAGAGAPTGGFTQQQIDDELRRRKVIK